MTSQHITADDWRLIQEALRRAALDGGAVSLERSRARFDAFYDAQMPEEVPNRFVAYWIWLTALGLSDPDYKTPPRRDGGAVSQRKCIRCQRPADRVLTWPMTGVSEDYCNDCHQAFEEEADRVQAHEDSLGTLGGIVRRPDFTLLPQQQDEARKMPKPRQVERSSEMSVTVRFCSCAEASRFESFLASCQEKNDE